MVGSDHPFGLQKHLKCLTVNKSLSNGPIVMVIIEGTSRDRDLHFRGYYHYAVKSLRRKSLPRMIITPFVHNTVCSLHRLFIMPHEMGLVHYAADFTYRSLCRNVEFSFRLLRRSLETKIDFGHTGVKKSDFFVKNIPKLNIVHTGVTHRESTPHSFIQTT